MYKYLDKQIHCFERKGLKILFCPDVKQKITYPERFSYTITTDSSGKRITPKVESNKTYWVIGDSLSMGYGVNDKESFPYILSQNLGKRVENFAVDSMGSVAIQEYLEESLSKYKKPEAIFWIFSVSDFVDDLHFMRIKENLFYRLFFKTQFYLRKNFFLFNYIKIILEKSSFSKERNKYSKLTSLPHKDHITYLSILNIKEICQKQNIQLYIMTAPDMNPETGKPDYSSKIQNEVKNFLIENKIQILDLSDHFKKFPNKNYYIKNDGHYSAYTNQLFAKYGYQAITK